MRRELLGKMQDGSEVYIDLDTSHAVSHFAHEPKLRAAVEKIIPTLIGGPEQVRIEADMGEIVGNSDLVETTDEDEIVYALRRGRTIYSRFAKGRKPHPSSWIAFALYKRTEKEYELRTAFVGHNTPSFPGGDYLPEQSREFWSRHALAWDSQDVVPGSETTECPW